MLDIIQRYVPVIERLQARLRPESKILEVGCGSGGVGVFVSNAEIVGCDLDIVENSLPENVRPITCSAESLPFEDESFDFTVSVDVLEHIFPPETRWRALREMLRVTRNELILAVPCGQKSLEYVRRYADFCRRRYADFDSRWIDEHLEYGHPTEQEIIEQIYRVNPKYDVRVENNANGAVWLLMMKLLIVLDKSYPGMAKALNLTFSYQNMRKNMARFRSIFKYLNFGHTIRKVFFISKTKDPNV